MANIKLWNFYTNTYDTIAAVTDANAINYYPANKIQENYYATLRDQGEQPIQALQAVYRSITYSD